MRQAIFIVPLFLVLLAVIYLFSPQFGGKAPPERFLDGQTLVLVNQKNLAARLDTFRENRLGRAVRSIDYARIMNDLGISEDRIEVLDTISRLTDAAQNDPVVRSTLGRDLTVALMPFQFQPEKSALQQLIDHTILICRPKRAAHAMELLRRISSRTAIEDTLYGPYAIKRFRFNAAITLAAAHVDSMVIVSADERLLRQCLDRYDNRIGSLAAAAQYMAEKKKFSGASSFGYANISGLVQLVARLRSVPAARVKEDQQYLADSRVSLYQSGMIGSWNNQNTMTVRAVLRFDPQRIPDSLQSLYTTLPEKTRSTQRVQNDTIWYYWSNNYSVTTFLELVRRHLNQEQQRRLNLLFQEIRGATEVEVETAIGWLKNDLTVAIKKSPERELLPIPLVLTAFKCSSPERIKTFIKRLITHYQVPVRKRTVNKQEVISWGDVAPMNAFEPSVAIYKDYVLVANNFRQIKEFISDHPDRERLDASKHFKRVSLGFLDENNSLLYVNLAEMNGQIKELIAWGGIMLALKDPVIANQATVLIDRLLNPLLDGLSMYEVIGSRKNLKNNQVIIEALTTLGHEE